VPIMLALGRWGATTMGERSPDQTIRGEWLALALNAFFDADAAQGLTATVALVLDGAPFTLRVEDGRLDVTPGTNGPADLTITTDPELLLQFLAGAPVLVPAEGDRQLLGRLPELFPLGG
jgi:SCP-2 sterol transfer family